MKSVLISIQPKWCELIASGKKTVEVRKTKPKLETPFKVYIYETQGRKYSLGVKADTIAKHDDDRFLDCARGNPPIKEDKNGTPYFSYGRMKVIGEFVCDYIEDFKEFEYGIDALHRHIKLNACIGYREIYDYLGFAKCGYGWHISNLVIYDKPKELSEFETKRTITTLTTEHNIEGIVHYPKKEIIFDKFIRPPQSWCYVEE